MRRTSTREHDVDLGTDTGIRDAWHEYGPGLRAFATRRLGDRHLAEDVLQETLLRAWRTAHRFDPARGSVRTWLYAIMSNLLVDTVRAQACRPRTLPIVDDPPARDELDALIGSLAMAEAVRRLSADHQQVIFYSYVAQHSYPEIAALLGVPVGTVRSRLFYARGALSNVLRTSVRAAA